MEDVGPFAPGHVCGAAFLGPHPSPDEFEAFDEPVVDPIRYHSGWRIPDAYDRRRLLADLIILQDDDGPGPPAMLTVIHTLFALLSKSARDTFGSYMEGMGAGAGALLQLDLRARCIDGDVPLEVVLTIWLGEDEPPASWAEALDRQAAWGACDWVKIGFRRNGELAAGTNDLGHGILKAVAKNEGEPAPLPWIGGPPSVRHFLGMRALPSAVRFTHRPSRSRAGYEAALELNMQSFDWLEGTTHVCERAIQLKDHLDRSLGLRSSDGAKKSWCDERLLPVPDLDFSERGLLSIRLGAILKGCRASIFLIDDFAVELPLRRRGRIHTLLYRMAQDHPDSTIIATVNTHEIARDIHREAHRQSIITTVFTMRAVRRV